METIHGTVERITYHTEDTGYTVVKLRVGARVDPITVTGKVPTIHTGEALEATGEWVQVPNWGRQFRAQSIKTTAPSSREGIEKYLGSGLIEGIGPVYAKKLVDKFGETIFDVIDTESKRLQEVEGIGTKRRQEIKASWEKQKTVRQIMVFLHQNGISTAKAVKIYQAYGDQAINQVKGNPYQLAADIHGIGFKTADGIARQLGLAEDAPERIRAGFTQALLTAGDDGHCALPRKDLLFNAAQLLNLAPDLLEPMLEIMMTQREVVPEMIDGRELMFPPHLLKAEENIAARLRQLLAQPGGYPPIDVNKALSWAEQHTQKSLAPGQEAAVRAALANRVLIITGGPGVGKTTILNTILKILTARGVKPVLAAPTGRAARRLGESTQLEAKTIHRLLEYQPGKGFTKNANAALQGDLFVLDETSMVDVALASAYLQALPTTGHLLLVGDADQLPSVGPGNVLRDLIASGMIPVVRLTEIFRQVATSQIITTAHAINAGQVPAFPDPTPKDSDCFFLSRDTPESILSTITHLASQRMPHAFQLDPVRDIQILTPMNRGVLGTQNLNLVLQAALNPPNEFKFEIERYGMTLRVGDKVIQIRNNYEKEAFNGDIGYISEIETDPVRVHVRFDEQRRVPYETGDLDELRLAYAITIHKSQGSEFPAVILPLSTQHYVMLQRNLLYTGLTRGRKRVVLVGQTSALEISVKQTGSLQRWSGLKSRLQPLSASMASLA
jgi:exodeoxyribonuclease V alpha subunit